MRLDKTKTNLDSITYKQPLRNLIKLVVNLRYFIALLLRKETFYFEVPMLFFLHIQSSSELIFLRRLYCLIDFLFIGIVIKIQIDVSLVCSGPVLALGLAREDAIDRWRGMLGPKEKEAAQENPSCLRAQFDVEAAQVNQLHGSDSLEAAEKEIEFFFPKEKTLAVIKPNAMNKKG